MFRPVINVNNVKEVRYGTTKIPFQKTLGQIIELLNKHGCHKIILQTDINEPKIGFVLEKKPYLINVPKVFVRGIYDDKIGIRIVKYYLEILLSLAKERVLDFDFLMLGSRVVNVQGDNLTLKEAVETLPPALLHEAMERRRLPESDGHVIDVEGGPVDEC